MIFIGPFKANAWIDNDDPEKPVYVNIFHINQHIDTIDTNISAIDAGADAIPSYLEKNTLLSWLSAGERDILSDLQKLGGKQEYHISGHASLEKEVKSGNASSARINVPPYWHGARVQVIALDPVNEPDFLSHDNV